MEIMLISNKETCIIHISFSKEIFEKGGASLDDLFLNNLS